MRRITNAYHARLLSKYIDLLNDERPRKARWFVRKHADRCAKDGTPFSQAVEVVNAIRREHGLAHLDKDGKPCCFAKPRRQRR